VKRTIFLAFVSVAFLGCAHHSMLSSGFRAPRTVSSRAVGPWDNPYRNDPKLAGVWICQLGECPYDQWRFEGKHPAGIFFYFWDGRVRQVGYEPDGTVYSDQWWPHRIEPGDDWFNVDFSQGSDPTFQHHADPRKKGSPSPNPAMPFRQAQGPEWIEGQRTAPAVTLAARPPSPAQPSCQPLQPLRLGAFDVARVIR
jgi:hypothetical protein